MGRELAWKSHHAGERTDEGTRVIKSDNVSWLDNHIRCLFEHQGCIVHLHYDLVSPEHKQLCWVLGASRYRIIESKWHSDTLSIAMQVDEMIIRHQVNFQCTPLLIKQPKDVSFVSPQHLVRVSNCRSAWVDRLTFCTRNPPKPSGSGRLWPIRILL